MTRRRLKCRAITRGDNCGSRRSCATRRSWKSGGRRFGRGLGAQTNVVTQTIGRTSAETPRRRAAGSNNAIDQRPLLGATQRGLIINNKSWRALGRIIWAPVTQVQLIGAYRRRRAAKVGPRELINWRAR